LKIYTRTGDRGDTALFGGGRVPKTHPRVQAYGTVDELNSFLGRAITRVGSGEIRERLSSIQHDLFTLGSHLATPPAREGRARPHLPPLPRDRVTQMEVWIDEAEGELAPLRAFILPGGSEGAAELHVCRTVCRRVERMVVRLGPDEPECEAIIQYLNRLSDLLFTLARLENHRAGAPDVEWRKEEDSP